MKFLEEYRNAEGAQKALNIIRQLTTKPWTIMEVCGGQTHAIVRYGIDQLLPEGVTLVHGPGCPVCVTPLEMIDAAIVLASQKDIVFCSFGDMLRVPGSKRDLLTVKALGGDVRVVYSPLDVISIAKLNPNRQVVFFAVGFETTAPTTALAVRLAKMQQVMNFSVLVSHVRVPPAMEAILASKNNRVQGFLAAGHVCTVMGYQEYEPIAARFKVPIVVTGFEPIDLLQGIGWCIRQLESGHAVVENQYARSVRREGNLTAQQWMSEVFRVRNRKWRGIGEIAESGLDLAPDYEEFDARRRFGLESVSVEESANCISGQILQGVKKPSECSAFALQCTPEHPLGATMVSSEGACAAYYRYRRT